ncbi:hypothetical protein BHM03_00011258 [Ensete ventricosum]|nr:hypothetical protein BHM03_00011258 [Ensete ventricosum]
MRIREQRHKKDHPDLKRGLFLLFHGILEDHEIVGLSYLGEVDVEEEGLLSVRHLYAVALVGIGGGDVNVVHALRDLLHLSLVFALRENRKERRNPNPIPGKASAFAPPKEEMQTPVRVWKSDIYMGRGKRVASELSSGRKPRVQKYTTRLSFVFMHYDSTNPQGPERPHISKNHQKKGRSLGALNEGRKRLSSTSLVLGSCNELYQI